ncbi:hypothetical protein QQP08_010202 [Theobroma cacao]|nr:hypothetical protein QQP08_010202 [Theobroma cacao]
MEAEKGPTSLQRNVYCLVNWSHAQDSVIGAGKRNESSFARMKIVDTEGKPKTTFELIWNKKIGDL